VVIKSILTCSNLSVGISSGFSRPMGFLFEVLFI
jgi:hypothetical protein